MNTGIVSTRYAQALLEYAKECKCENEIYKNMFQLIATITNVQEFLIVLQNPLLSRDEKVKLLCDAVNNNKDCFHKFASLVMKQGREELLIHIAHAYISLYRKEKNILAVKLTTAISLSPDLEDKIVSSIVKDGYNNVELENIVDSSIIGGFLLEADSKRLDASISGALERVKKQIVDNNRRLV